MCLSFEDNCVQTMHCKNYSHLKMQLNNFLSRNVRKRCGKPVLSPKDIKKLTKKFFNIYLNWKIYSFFSLLVSIICRIVSLKRIKYNLTIYKSLDYIENLCDVTFKSVLYECVSYSHKQKVPFINIIVFYL